MAASDGVIRCVLSGTYRKDQPGLMEAYKELATCGCQILSPHRLEFDGQDQDVLFVKDRAERDISEELIEKHHLMSTSQSDFVWLHAPDGYMGLSAAFEVGYAFASNVPVFSKSEPTDPNLRNFITVVPSVYEAMRRLAG